MYCRISHIRKLIPGDTKEAVHDNTAGAMTVARRHLGTLLSPKACIAFIEEVAADLVHTSALRCPALSPCMHACRHVN